MYCQIRLGARPVRPLVLESVTGGQRTATYKWLELYLLLWANISTRTRSKRFLIPCPCQLNMNVRPYHSQAEQQMWQNQVINERNSSQSKKVQVHLKVHVKAKNAYSDERPDQFNQCKMQKALQYQETPAALSKEVVGLGLGLIRNAVRSLSHCTIHSPENMKELHVSMMLVSCRTD